MISYKKKGTQILYDHSIQSCFIKGYQKLIKCWEFPFLYQCIDSKIYFLLEGMGITDPFADFFLRKVICICSRPKGTATKIDLHLLKGHLSALHNFLPVPVILFDS